MYVYISQHNLKRITSSQTRTTLFFFKYKKQFVIIIRILTGEMKVMNIHENDKVQLVNNINVSFRRCFGIDTYK